MKRIEVEVSFEKTGKNVAQGRVVLVSDSDCAETLVELLHKAVVDRDWGQMVICSANLDRLEQDDEAGVVLRKKALAMPA